MTQEIIQLIISLAALTLSTIIILISVETAKKNVRLSIQQALFKTVSDKAKDCNVVWTNEPKIKTGDNESPHYLVMTELVISLEVIDKAFELFSKNQNSITTFKKDYYYLLYKQLTPDLRGWLRRTPQIAERLKKEFKEPNRYYDKQIKDVFSALEPHFDEIL